MKANPTVVPIFEVDVEAIINKEEDLASFDLVPRQEVQGAKVIQLLDHQVESSVRERIEQEEREAMLMAEDIYDKKFGNSTRVKEDDVKEINLGIEANPQLVRISTQVKGQFLQDLVKLLQDYKDIFAWDYSQVKGIDASLHQH